MSAPPPPGVLWAFRCQELPVSLPGGQGEAFRCGEIVLKPCADPVEACWIAQLHLDVRQVGFRLPRPVRTTGGEWVVDGWQAWGLVAGSHSRDRWGEVIAACRAFHDAVSHLTRPDFLDARNTPFSRADRIAWDDEPADVHPRLRPVIEKLQSFVEPIDLPNQIIHADFTENVLFEENRRPAVIDLSPYWRPAEYAQAIVVVDALDWCGADESILRWVTDIPEMYQLMVRAEIFRIAIHDGFHKLGVDRLDAVEGHATTVDMLAQHLD